MFYTIVNNFCMNKTQFIKRLSENCNIDKTVCGFVLNSAYFLLCDSLKKGETLNIKGFGKFYVKFRRERFLKRGNQTLLIGTKNVPVFKMGKTFKNIIG